MFNTLYNIAGGIALTIGAIGASDDFDGAQIAQQAFFCPEEESEILDEQELATDDVLVAKDVNEWDEIAAKFMSMSLTGADELSDDEKLEIVVLTEEIPDDITENSEEVSQIEENSQPEGLSEEEFYSMLEHQFNVAMEDLDSVNSNSEPLIIGAAPEPKTESELDEDVPSVVFQFSEDNNAENALENKLASSKTDAEEVVQLEQTLQIDNLSDRIFKDDNPWIISHGLPDIPDEDMNLLVNPKAKTETAVEAEEQKSIEDVSVNEIPFIDSDALIVPEVDEPELETLDNPLFEDVKNETAEEVEAENIDVEDVEAEEVEAENIDVEDVEAEDVQTENIDVEDADVKEVEAENANDDNFVVGPLDDVAAEAETNEEVLVIPSTEIPPAVITEEQRAKISEEVDAIVNQTDNFDSWIPRQIPVNGSIEDTEPQIKPEDAFIQEFSRKNVKESILENTGIELND